MSNIEQGHEVMDQMRARLAEMHLLGPVQGMNKPRDEDLFNCRSKEQQVYADGIMRWAREYIYGIKSEVPSALKQEVFLVAPRRQGPNRGW